MKILVINGVNMNLLGKRETEVYGADTLEALNGRIMEKAKELSVKVDFCQSNIEGEIVNRLHQAMNEKYDGIVINPAAYTHYSYAIRDAVKAISIPTIEVHMSNVHAREAFRENSVIVPACLGQICGLGEYSYSAAIYALCLMMKKDDSKSDIDRI